MDTTTNPGADYTPEETVFMLAMDRYKRVNNRRFPSWREVLGVLQALGYRQVEAAAFTPARAKEVFQTWYSDDDRRKTRR